jgi:hypothetical protein
VRGLQDKSARLTTALDGWMQGRPVVWPRPSRMPLNRLVGVAGDGLAQSTGRPARRAPSWRTVGSGGTGRIKLLRRRNGGQDTLSSHTTAARHQQHDGEHIEPHEYEE